MQSHSSLRYNYLRKHGGLIWFPCNGFLNSYDPYGKTLTRESYNVIEVLVFTSLNVYLHNLREHLFVAYTFTPFTYSYFLSV